MKAGSPKRPAKTAKPQPKADRPFAPGYGIAAAKAGKGLLPWGWVARKMNVPDVLAGHSLRRYG